MVDRWAEDFDRCEVLDAEDGCNVMHIIGSALCVLLQRSESEAEAAGTAGPL
jgi:hypothetical protein